MRTLLVLLLLCLCETGHSDCQSDCLTCSDALPKQVRFNAMLCLLDCEGGGPPMVSWDCRRALLSAGSMLRKRSEEQAEALFPQQEDPAETDLLMPAALERFHHVARALAAADPDSKSNDALSFGDEYQEEAGQEAAAGGEDDAGLSLSKRFGGFVKGRHGYRKFLSPGRSYQKRYGGFIGIRKSARKWNNQKRFSEFLKQYLGMSARATEFNSVSEDLAQPSDA